MERPLGGATRGRDAAEDGGDDDYMSEKFLAQETNRKKSIGKKQPPTKQLPKKEAERKALEEGLSKQIDQSNKGFQLLSKMGFKPGMGLGKDEAGMKVPLAVQIKGNRGGLGKDEDERRMVEEEAQKRAKVETITIEGFQAQQAAKFKERHLMGLLREGRQIAYQLDCEKDVKESPYAPKEDADEDTLDERGRGALRDRQPKRRADDDEIPPSRLPSLVDEVTQYLRNNHHYCLFCGIKFASIDAMRARCPGPTEEAHE